MQLKFHPGGELATRVVPRECYVGPPEFVPPAAESRTPHPRGARLRRRLLAWLRRRGGATLSEIGKRFGQASAVTTLLALAEAGLIDVLDHDRFRAKGAS